MGPCTFLASSILPCSARELGDSGRMIPAIRMMKPGTAAHHYHYQSEHGESSLGWIILMAVCLCLTLSTQYSSGTACRLTCNCQRQPPTPWVDVPGTQIDAACTQQLWIKVSCQTTPAISAVQVRLAHGHVREHGTREQHVYRGKHASSVIQWPNKECNVLKPEAWVPYLPQGYLQCNKGTSARSSRQSWCLIMNVLLATLLRFSRDACMYDHCALTNGDHQLEDDIEGAAQLGWRHLCTDTSATLRDWNV